MSTRRDRIITLLDNYVDVENGLQDRAFRGDDFVPRMSRAWSHPSYRELRRLLTFMPVETPSPYWHLAEKYFRYTEHRRAFCPRCLRTAPPSEVGSLHKHGQRTVQMVPRTIRIHKLVDLKQLALRCGLARGEFRGEPFVPDDLLALVA